MTGCWVHLYINGSSRGESKNYVVLCNMPRQNSWSMWRHKPAFQCEGRVLFNGCHYIGAAITPDCTLQRLGQLYDHTLNENWSCRRLADTRDLKSLSEDRVWGCPRWRHWKSQNCSLIRMIVGLSFCSAFWKLWRGERNHSCIDDAVWTRLQEPFHAGP